MPTLTLQTILEMLPPGRHVDLLKADAQGFDLHIVESGGTALHLLRHVQLEVPLATRGCSPLYKAQPTCVQILRRMRALNFSVYKVEVDFKPGLPWRADNWTERDCFKARPQPPRDNGFRGQQCEVDVTFVHSADPGAPARGSVEQQSAWRTRRAAGSE